MLNGYIIKYSLSPVFFGSGLIVTRGSFKDVFVEELHSKGNGSLMIFGDAAISLIEIIEVIILGCLQLCSQQDGHFLII